MATDEGKRVKYIIKGEVTLNDTTLEEAITHLRECVEKLREGASAEIQLSVPRMTGMKL